MGFFSNIICAAIETVVAPVKIIGDVADGKPVADAIVDAASDIEEELRHKP